MTGTKPISQVESASQADFFRMLDEKIAQVSSYCIYLLDNCWEENISHHRKDNIECLFYELSKHERRSLQLY